MKGYLWIAYVLIGLGLGSWITASTKNTEIAQIEKDYSDAAKATAELHLEVLKDRDAQQQKLQQQLSAIDTQHYGELIHAQDTINRLTDKLSVAERRLSVRTVQATASGPLRTGTEPTRLDDGTGERRVIHPEDAAAIVRVTGQADRCRVKLTGLQAWVQSLRQPQEVVPSVVPSIKATHTGPAKTGPVEASRVSPSAPPDVFRGS